MIHSIKKKIGTEIKEITIFKTYFMKKFYYFFLTKKENGKILIGLKPSNLSDAKKQIKNKYHIYTRIIE